MNEQATDLDAIRHIIDRQFTSMSWSAGGGPDAAMFKRDLIPGAPLYPAARPLLATSEDEFLKRMGGLAQTTLTSLHERPIGNQILVFGNIAVAAAASENTENEGEVNRSVEMFLLVKSGGEWKIAGQAWDKETSGTPIPEKLLAAADPALHSPWKP